MHRVHYRPVLGLGLRGVSRSLWHLHRAGGLSNPRTQPKLSFSGGSASLAKKPLDFDVSFRRASHLDVPIPRLKKNDAVLASAHLFVDAPRLGFSKDTGKIGHVTVQLPETNTLT